MIAIIALAFLSAATPRCDGASAQARMCGCPRVYSPVCGDNQRTYRNQCLLECLGVGLLRGGRCRARSVRPRRRDCGCPHRERPVCGSNGVSYINACFFNCDRFKHLLLTIQYLGPCEAAQTDLKLGSKLAPACNCSLLYEPVCGSNNATYANVCRLNCVAKVAPGLKVAHAGRCDATRARGGRAPCACPGLYKPVCGTNNATFANKCRLRCAAELVRPYGLAVRHHGTCARPGLPDCAGECGGARDPVCGSNDVTYENACLLGCALDPKPTVRAKGPCATVSAPGCRCPAVIAPVCGSDDITYMNACRLECAAAASGRGLHQLHPGDCRKDFARERGKRKSPLRLQASGSDETESASAQEERRLALESAQSEADDPADPSDPAPRPRTTPAPCRCRRDPAPVCANNGRTYASACHAQCDKTTDEDLEILHQGQCNRELQSSID